MCTYRVTNYKLLVEHVQKFKLYPNVANNKGRLRNCFTATGVENASTNIAFIRATE